MGAEFGEIDVGLFHLVCSDLRVLCPVLYNQLNCVSEDDLYILAPPVGNCLNCVSSRKSGYALKQNNKMTTVKYISQNGILTKRKICLRCTKCGVNYNYSKYGSGKEGYRFYAEERAAVEANDSTFVHRTVYKLQWSLRFVLKEYMLIV